MPHDRSRAKQNPPVVVHGGSAPFMVVSQVSSRFLFSAMRVRIAHVLRRYALDGTFDEGHAARTLRHWRQLDVERYPHEPFLNRVWSLRDNLTAYDAIYVALAEALGELMLTADRRLAGSPGLNIRVELV